LRAATGKLFTTRAASRCLPWRIKLGDSSRSGSTFLQPLYFGLRTDLPPRANAKLCDDATFMHYDYLPQQSGCNWQFLRVPFSLAGNGGNDMYGGHATVV
jgi:hypothetical protein